MFRGGRVDSRGTGITSGLMDDTGYADGGRVGFQVGGGLFSSGPYNPYSANNIFSGTSLGYSPTLNFSTSPKPLFSDYDPLANTSPKPSLSDRAGPGPQKIIPRSRIPDLPPVKDFSIYKQEYIDTFGRTPTARDLMDYARYKDKYQESTEEVNKFLELEAKKPVKTETGTETGTGKGTGKGNIDLLSDEEDITRQSKLYEKLLGGEEAKAQAGFDALLAAAPAFFKGRNLREAAPQVLESINKSGAFDKPRDIKQAAAQLAIQRRILMDKAAAEENQRLALARIAAESREKGFTEELKQIKEITGRGAIDDEISFDFSKLRSNEFYQQIQKYKDGNQISIVNPKTGQRLYLKIKSTDPKNPNAPKGFERIGGNI